jgi:hypothetical protein
VHPYKINYFEQESLPGKSTSKTKLRKFSLRAHGHFTMFYREEDIS